MLTATIGLVALSCVVALFGILSARNAAKLSRSKKFSERSDGPSSDEPNPAENQTQKTSPEMFNALGGSGQLRPNHK